MFLTPLRKMLAEPFGYAPREPSTLATAAAIATIAGGTAAVAGALGVFGGAKAPSAMAMPAATPAIPTPDSAAITEVQKRSVALQQQTSGRLSTILTGTDNKLGA